MQPKTLQNRNPGAAPGIHALTAGAGLRGLLDAMPSGMLTVDRTGHIIDANVAVWRIWAYDDRAIVGRRLSQLIPTIELAKLVGLSEAQDKRAANDACNALSATGVKSTGDLFPIAVTIASDGGAITLFCEDMSERVATEARLREIAADLAHWGRQSAMADLAVDLAHELNQPLAAAGNFLFAARTLIERGGCRRVVADLVRRGETQARRASGLIRRMRDFAANRPVEHRAESVSAIVDDACGLMFLCIKRNEVSIVLDLEPGADRVVVDRIQIEQVLVNLLRNAVEALAERETPGRITIASRRVDDIVELSVVDNGPGLSAGLTARLGARFVTSKGRSGMGIGLSISKRIVEAHGGTLTADDQPAGGAVFRFTLPSNHGSNAC